jgi:hypothetical protein
MKVSRGVKVETLREVTVCISCSFGLDRIPVASWKLSLTDLD